jgi:hypothetical protein
MIELLYSALKGFGIMIVAYVVFKVYEYLWILNRLAFYRDQGIPVQANATTPIYHTAIDWMRHEKIVKENPEPMMLPHSWTLEDFAKSQGDEHYDGKKYPLLAYVMQG